MHQNEESLFHDAFEIEDPKSRGAFLDQACGGDYELRGRIERLISVFPKGSMLEPAREISAGFGDAKSNHEQVGDTIGNYKLLEQLGEGGMGRVYMAQQTKPVRRKVALKIIKPGMDSGQVVARFEGERQTLAMMDHPNIAKIFDAGTTNSGRPFFVMELVKGLPVTQFCDEQKLSTEDRLKLFRLVCKAVQHAHQKGIIHRDLKPSNIMIAMYDDQPVPKVIDFGVAKATSEPLMEDTFFTRFGEVIGTLQYMSPEQAQFNQLDIDTRSDIYSLGAVLYELLSGEPPFERERLRNQAFDETLRMIREEEPTKPSAKLRSATSSTQTAINRRTTTEKLNSIVRGDLDWIVLKALEKDRARRYETADALALDVQHYLDKEPVSAGPPTKRYRFRKFALRNQKALMAATAIGISLVLGIVTTTWQATRASRALKEKTTALEEKTTALEEKTIALEQSRASLKKSSIMTDLVLHEIIESATPESGSPNATVREALLIVEKKMDSEGVSDSQLEGWLRNQLAGYFFSIGEYSPAKRNFLRAYKLRIKILGSDAEETLSTACGLGALYSELGEHEQAVAVLKKVSDTYSRLFGGNRSLVASNHYGIALSHAGRNKEAEEIFLGIIKDARRLGFVTTEANANNNLAAAYYAMEDFDKAEAYWTTAREMFGSIHGDDHPITMAPELSLALLPTAIGEHHESKRLLNSLLPRREAIYGLEGPETIRLVRNLGNVHHRLAEYTEATEFRRRVLSANLKRFGDKDRATLEAMCDLGLSLEHLDSEESMQIYEKVVEIATRKLGPQDESTISYLNDLGNQARRFQDHKRATDCFQKIIEARQTRRSENPDDNGNLWMLGGAYCNLGLVQLHTQQNPEALQSGTSAIELLEELNTKNSRPEYKEFLGKSYLLRAKAKCRLKKYEQSLVDLQSSLAMAESEGRKGYLNVIRAQIVAAQGNYADACRAAEKINKRFAGVSGCHYELAVVYSIASKMAGKSPSDSSDQQVAQYVDKCFESLESARDLGHFELMTNVIDFQANLNFASIRDDPRYSQFVESLSPPDKK